MRLFLAAQELGNVNVRGGGSQHPSHVAAQLPAWAFAWGFQMEQGGAPGEDPERLPWCWRLCYGACVACFGPVECLGVITGAPSKPPAGLGVRCRRDGGRRMAVGDERMFERAGDDLSAAPERPRRPAPLALPPSWRKAGGTLGERWGHRGTGTDTGALC